MNNLFITEDCDKDSVIPAAVQICSLPQADNILEVEDFNDRYATELQTDSELVVESVGYAAGDNTTENHQTMKARAIAHCLDRKKFIHMQSGSNLLNDRDEGLMTYLFPNLDLL